MRQVGFPACLTENVPTGHKRSEPNTYIQNEHKTDGDLAGQEKGLKKTAREILLPGKISHEAVRCPVEMATERYLAKRSRLRKPLFHVVNWSWQ